MTVETEAVDDNRCQIHHGLIENFILATEVVRQINRELEAYATGMIVVSQLQVEKQLHGIFRCHLPSLSNDI